MDEDTLRDIYTCIVPHHTWDSEPTEPRKSDISISVSLPSIPVYLLRLRNVPDYYRTGRALITTNEGGTFVGWNLLVFGTRVFF